MKNIIPAALLVILCITCGVTGYFLGKNPSPKYTISIHENLNASNEAKLFDSSFENSELISKYDAQILIKELSKAAWTNSNFLKKGSWKVLLSNGTKIHLSMYGGFFWIEGVPGSFLIQPSQKSEYSKILGDIHKRTVTWRSM